MAKKKEKSKKKSSQVYKLYEGGKRKNQFCPKCGEGVYLASHKNRKTCGKCGYTEFSK